jgi:3-oxoacyl-[acyl-carrier protein] reductase
MMEGEKEVGMLDGRVAIITGSSRGIGRAIALIFSQNGARLVLNHKNTGRDIEETVVLLTASKADFIIVRGDIGDKDFVQEMVKQAKGKYGRIDILVNNAGITKDRPIQLMQEAQWDEVLDTNLKGTFLCSKGVLGSMMEQKYGRIVNITSISAVAGREGQVNYGAAKAGVIGFTKCLAREVAKHNILVNAVVVGVIDTLMTKRLPKGIIEDLMKMIPMGRIGQPEEVANCCLFLASELSSYVTGATLNVSGGGYM